MKSLMTYSYAINYKNILKSWHSLSHQTIHNLHDNSRVQMYVDKLNIAGYSYFSNSRSSRLTSLFCTLQTVDISARSRFVGKYTFWVSMGVVGIDFRTNRLSTTKNVMVTEVDDGRWHHWWRRSSRVYIRPACVWSARVCGPHVLDKLPTAVCSVVSVMMERTWLDNESGRFHHFHHLHDNRSPEDSEWTRTELAGGRVLLDTLRDCFDDDVRSNRLPYRCGAHDWRTL